MKKLFMIIPLVLILCFMVGCQKGEEVAEEAVAELAGLSDEDVAAIKTAHDSILQATLAGNWEATVEFYTEDAILIMEGIVIEGREVYKETLKALSVVSPTVTAANITIEEIDGRYDLAFVRGTSSTTMGRKGVPEPIQRTGKFIEIMRKQDDGTWLIDRSIVAMD
ncbi:MAG: DUF4440 domain-containing protein [Candidatus Aminicenantes bacterium]|nr:DUF4440 domain-containing protein [Candidatus Aminicenantes bacterium]